MSNRVYIIWKWIGALAGAAMVNDCDPEKPVNSVFSFLQLLLHHGCSMSMEGQRTQVGRSVVHLSSVAN